MFGCDIHIHIQNSSFLGFRRLYICYNPNSRSTHMAYGSTHGVLVDPYSTGRPILDGSTRHDMGRPNEYGSTRLKNYLFGSTQIVRTDEHKKISIWVDPTSKKNRFTDPGHPISTRVNIYTNWVILLFGLVVDPLSKLTHMSYGSTQGVKSVKNTLK